MASCVCLMAFNFFLISCGDGLSLSFLMSFSLAGILQFLKQSSVDHVKGFDQSLHVSHMDL